MYRLYVAMSSRCQLQAKLLFALAVVGIAAGTIVLFTVDDAFWASLASDLELEDNNAEDLDVQDNKGLAGLFTVLGSSYLLCLASCCCCGDRAVKVLALLSPLVFFLSAVAYVVTLCLAIAEFSHASGGTATFPMHVVVACLSFLGLMVGSLACCFAGCCLHLAFPEPRGPRPKKTTALNTALQRISLGTLSLGGLLFLGVAIRLASNRVFEAPVFMMLGVVGLFVTFCHMFLVASVFPESDV